MTPHTPRLLGGVLRGDMCELSAAQRAREQAAGGQRLYCVSDKLRLALRFFMIILRDWEPRVM